MDQQIQNARPAPPIEIEKEEDERFHVIRLHPKRYEHEQEIVHVHAGSSKKDWDFRMRRNELIPVPEAVLDALKNAKYPHYQMPSDEDMLQGKKEKIVGQIQRFTFDTVFSDIPKDIFMKLRKRASDPTAKPVTEKEIQEMLNRRKN